VAAASILTGASAIGTPVTGSSWVIPLVEVVTVIWLVGVGGRLIRLPTALTVLVQLIGFSIAMTSLFTTSGIGGVLPNADAVSEASTLLSGAWTQIAITSPPTPSTPELSFLIALAVGCAALIADFLVAKVRAPALVALPLLCLYSVPASISGTLLPWYSFAAPAVLYAVLLAVASHRDRRTGVRAGAGLAISGGAIIAMATIASLVIAGSVTAIGTTGRLPHTNGGGGGGGGGSIGLSPISLLRGSLRTSDPVDVLTASGLKAPEYFSTVALTKWTPNQGWSVGNLQADISDVNGRLSGSALGLADSAISVTAQGYQDRFLPILSGTIAVSGLSDSWNFDSSLGTVFRTDKIKPQPYQLVVNETKPTQTALRSDGVVAGGDLTATGSLAASVRSTAAQVTAGSSDAYDKALDLQQWFTGSANGFKYSLDVVPGNSGDALVDFLQNKQGYCEQYASAMAIMLRALNIPTRVVVGFTQGVKEADGSYLITSHDAHAWVEVQFVQSGWVRFDPTPPVDGQTRLQGFQGPTAPASSTAAKTSTATPTSAAPAPGAISTSTTTQNAKSSAAATQVVIAGRAVNASSTDWWKAALLVAFAIAVLLALLAFPTVLRRSRRQRRVRQMTVGGSGAASAAWAEIEDTCIDHGIVRHSAESARVTANRLARQAHLSDDAKVDLRALVIAAEQEWYDRPQCTTSGPSTAGPPPAQFGLAAGVVSVIEGLREHAPVQLLDRIVPRSLKRTKR